VCKLCERKRLSGNGKSKYGVLEDSAFVEYHDKGITLPLLKEKISVEDKETERRYQVRT
jgi:hypothetical protein